MQDAETGTKVLPSYECCATVTGVQGTPTGAVVVQMFQGNQPPSGWMEGNSHVGKEEKVGSSLAHWAKRSQHPSNRPPNWSLYTHPSALLSAFLREASWCCGREVLNTESQAGQSAQSKCLQSVQPQTGHLCHSPSHQGSGTIVEEKKDRL